MTDEHRAAVLARKLLWFVTKLPERYIDATEQYHIERNQGRLIEQARAWLAASLEAPTFEQIRQDLLATIQRALADAPPSIGGDQEMGPTCSTCGLEMMDFEIDWNREHEMPYSQARCSKCDPSVKADAPTEQEAGES